MSLARVSGSSVLGIAQLRLENKPRLTSNIVTGWATERVCVFSIATGQIKLVSKDGLTPKQ
jgi:hypothetical protein